ncbi:Trypsin domain containing protein, partial [Asbolus verrucosus]
KELHPQTENKNYQSVAKSSLLPDSKNCGIYEEDRIYRGENAAEDEYPWNALLKYKTEDGKKEFYCAGVLISERYILTAAHCIKGRNLPNNTKLLSVRLGEDYIETNPDCYHIGFTWRQCLDPSIDVPVEQTIVHEDYDPKDPNQYHDIALLRLQSKAPIQETSKCEKALNVKLDQNQLCVGKRQGHKLCADDSGGSLVTAVVTDYNSVNFIVAAVKSFGTCDSEDRASVYTRVDDYIDWIVSKLKP